MRDLWIVFFCYLAYPTVAFSCVCVSLPGPALNNKQDRVFLGTVLAVADAPPTSDFEFLDRRKAQIRVVESFAGLSPGTEDVEVSTGVGGGDCGVPFRVGDVYLIDAYAGKDGRLHAGICGATQKADRAAAALRILRKRRDGPPWPSLLGRIQQYERNLRDSMGPYPARPLANVLVRLKADGQVYESRADADGLYEFYDLPPGRYEWAPDLPVGTTLSWAIDGRKSEVQFTLDGSECQERNIVVFASASIQGRVLDARNQPVPHARVCIVRANESPLSKEGELYGERTGKDGYFKFVHIPPGSYWLVINPEDATAPRYPFRRTFYPGVPDSGAAGIITIRGGEEIKAADIRIAP